VVSAYEMESVGLHAVSRKTTSGIDNNARYLVGTNFIVWLFHGCGHLYSRCEIPVEEDRRWAALRCETEMTQHLVAPTCRSYGEGVHFAKLLRYRQVQRFERLESSSC
jgi:hypothetical protein